MSDHQSHRNESRENVLRTAEPHVETVPLDSVPSETATSESVSLQYDPSETAAPEVGTAEGVTSGIAPQMTSPYIKPLHLIFDADDVMSETPDLADEEKSKDVN